MAHKRSITATLAILFLMARLLPVAADSAPSAETPNQQLIRALLGHETHIGGMIFLDEFSSLPPEQAQAARQKLVLADVQAALAAGASPNAKAGAEESGRPALTMAATRGFTDVVDLLLDKGADVHGTDPYGNTILQQIRGDVPLAIVQKLVQKGANINMAAGRNVSPFQWFIEQGRIDIVQLMITHGADVNRRGSFGETPLMSAAHFGRLDIIKLLLHHGADIHAQGQDHDTAMSWAADSIDRSDNTAILQFLLDNKLAVNEKAWEGQCNSPLGMAAWFGNVANVKWLLAHGANVNAVDHSGKTPLWYTRDRMREGDVNQKELCTKIIALLKAAGAKN